MILNTQIQMSDFEQLVLNRNVKTNDILKCSVLYIEKTK